MDPRTLSDDFNGADGRPTSRFSQNHSLPNSSEDQWGYHRAKSLGTLTSPLEVDEQISARPSKICGWSASEISKSESTVSSNVFSASSGRPYSRHTTCTSLDSTSHALSTRKSEESLSASNGQRGASSGWSPATTRSTAFNIDDYVSSDDDSFTTARKGTQITAEGEEDLLFKPGYGITGVALPGLEEIEEDAVYPAISCRSNRSNSVSSDGSVAIAASPIDNRFSMARDIPMPLRHVRSDPEVEFYGTFGRCSMRDHFKESETSTSAGDERNMPSAVDFEDYFRPPPTRTGTESGVLDEMYALSRGLTRLSALGSPNDRNVGGSDGGPARSVAETVKEEKAKVDIATAIRLRKEEKARRRAEGLRNSREKRSTMTFDEMGEDEAIAKLKELPGDGNEDGDLGRRRHTDGKGKDVTVE
ncbi:hypothetical protein VP1G_04156 [Cytospora mali]|uniref:Uncharacterized protein n=1 Tax=Cytospora mali TaxID=578113 RepID=A0A194UZ05_CYTMA|nr:hypothetical protein VP1G_04156 [Valsa mali var. pyri (nom. inval.)]